MNNVQWLFEVFPGEHRSLSMLASVGSTEGEALWMKGAAFVALSPTLLD
jgi:hypothetical protein